MDPTVLDIPISDGGPSAPAWAFFTAILAGIVTVLVEVVRRPRKLEKRLDAVQEVAQEAANNSHPVSNGFTSGVNSKLDQLTKAVDRIERVQLEHLNWHLHQKEGQ